MGIVSTAFLQLSCDQQWKSYSRNPALAFDILIIWWERADFWPCNLLGNLGKLLARRPSSSQFRPPPPGRHHHAARAGAHGWLGSPPDPGQGLCDPERPRGAGSIGRTGHGGRGVQGSEPGADWAAYWRLLFREITFEDIKTSEEKYIGSEEELADIKQAYVDSRAIWIKSCSLYFVQNTPTNIIQQAIDSGEVPPFKAFLKESKQKMNARKRRAQEEAKEAEKTRKELGLGGEPGDLKALIQSRQKD
ncbi:dnaJ homolog subfamily C member 9-like [Macrotis lagotis]|uniref:dnaJ homolog subfamily C member 9-like n=1 Tax=Macrotis lagotis TaxID=92651 RepID=UPI003D69F91A